jgi:general stress protein YciG
METLFTQQNIEATGQQNAEALVPPTTPSKPAKQRRGFAMLDATRRQEIARKGGKLAHALGRAHQFTHDEARIAGRKGGLARRQTATDSVAS